MERVYKEKDREGIYREGWRGYIKRRMGRVKKEKDGKGIYKKKDGEGI